jgi:hypothetical protein
MGMLGAGESGERLQLTDGDDVEDADIVKDEEEEAKG